MAQRGVDGKPYPRAVRLYTILEIHWSSIDGANPTLDLLSLHPQKLLNIVRWWGLERIEPDKREQWEFDLDSPLPWETDREPSPEQLEREGQDFMNFMTSFNG